MGLSQVRQPGRPRVLAAVLTEAAAELAFMTVFTLEIFCKFASMGVFMEENAFLKTGWNQLDFLVVVVGWLPYLGFLVGILLSPFFLLLSFCFFFTEGSL